MNVLVELSDFAQCQNVYTAGFQAEMTLFFIYYLYDITVIAAH